MECHSFNIALSLQGQLHSLNTHVVHGFYFLWHNMNRVLRVGGRITMVTVLLTWNLCETKCCTTSTQTYTMYRLIYWVYLLIFSHKCPLIWPRRKSNHRFSTRFTSVFRQDLFILFFGTIGPYSAISLFCFSSRVDPLSKKGCILHIGQ